GQLPRRAPLAELDAPSVDDRGGLLQTDLDGRIACGELHAPALHPDVASQGSASARRGPAAPRACESASAAAIHSVSPGAGRAGGPIAATRSVAYRPEANSSEATTRESSGRFVSTPRTTQSARARRALSIAAARVGAETTSLARSGSKSRPTAVPGPTPAATRTPGPTRPPQTARE